MQNKQVRLYTAVAVLCLSRSAWGQDIEADSVKGEIHIFSSTVMRVQVALGDFHGGRGFSAAPVSSDGRFEFRHVPYGEYRLTVSDASDHPIYQQMITVHDRQQLLTVEVTPREAPKAGTGVVSARQLLHPPSKKAFQAFVAGQKLAEAADHEKAAAQFEKATRLSPDYADAWVDLGAEHIFLKRYEEALGELTRAGEVDRPTPLILSDKAFALYALRRYDEGTQAAREALRLDPSYAQAQYMLGSFLVHDKRTRAEGMEQLQAAARTFPAARAELDQIRRVSAQVVTHP